MTDPPPAAPDPSPHALFAQPDFVRFQLARFVSTVGTQVSSVAVGWEVYERTRSKLDLGYVGLAQFVPGVALALVTGAVADRFDRRRVVALCHAATALCYAALWALSRARPASLAPVFATLVAFGATRAFLGPANQSLLPRLVPPAQLGQALAMGSTVWQVAAVSGPALGGLLFGLHRGGAYLVSAACALTSAALALSLGVSGAPTTAPPRRPGWDELLAGVRYVRGNPVVLGAVTLDLFAVLLGGAVALLPVFARDVLHAGVLGLGAMRAAPAVGAGLMALWLAYRPLGRRAGKTLLVAVGVFGAATVAFALSRDVALSAAALAVTGAADMVSVVVRQHVVQLATPDAMRGRVSAVNLVFISSSNELGEFESGVTAEWLGPVKAALLGGVGTLLVVALWWRYFPALRDVDRLSDLRAKEPA
ncbi:MAG: MFS transporter [Polyangiales bacterium]